MNNMILLDVLKDLNQNRKIKLRAKKVNKKQGSRYSLYLDLYVNGVRKYDYLRLYLYGTSATMQQDFKNFEIAKTIRDKKELELITSINGFELNSSNLNADFFDFFEEVANDKGYDVYTSSLVQLRRFHSSVSDTAVLPFKNCTSQYIEEFIKFLHSKKLKKTTVKNYFVVMKVILNVAKRKGIITNNPADNIVVKDERAEKVFLTETELRALKAAAVPDDLKIVQRLFIFGAFTGLRRSDLLKLKYSDISEGYITFKAKKTKKLDRVKLHQIANEIVEFQSNDNPLKSKYVFDLQSPSMLNKHIRQVAKIAKINKPKISIHSSRHTFAVISLNAGIDIYTLSRLLQHSSVKTTEIYLHLVDKRKDEAIDLLPNL